MRRKLTGTPYALEDLARFCKAKSLAGPLPKSAAHQRSTLRLILKRAGDSAARLAEFSRIMVLPRKRSERLGRPYALNSQESKPLRSSIGRI